MDEDVFSCEILSQLGQYCHGFVYVHFCIKPEGLFSVISLIFCNKGTLQSLEVGIDI